MSSTFFGTDGVRGPANLYPIQADSLLRLGQALGLWLQQQPRQRSDTTPTVLIGKDTRLSGYMIEQALASALNSMGVRVLLTGPLPTPGIGFVAKNMRADAGIVISASHNPYTDNGIKFFGPDGFKFSTQVEKKIQHLFEQNQFHSHLAPTHKIGRTRRVDDALGRYIVHIKNTFPLQHNLSGLKVVVDCANGAAYRVAPLVLEELGAQVIVLSNTPNGRNINLNCGSLHPEIMQQNILQHQAHIGIALDGDADRCILADEQGQLLTGDPILAILAEQMLGSLHTLVGTHMSNLGLEKFCQTKNLKFIRTHVGDKYVVECMRQHKLTLGGETSGHIINLTHSTTGDGLVAALGVLAAMRSSNKSLSELRKIMPELPQTLLNIKVHKTPPLETISGYTAAIQQAQSQLTPHGRVYVRYSGTEAVVRILVEGPDAQLNSQTSQKIAQLFKQN